MKIGVLLWYLSFIMAGLALLAMLTGCGSAGKIEDLKPLEGKVGEAKDAASKAEAFLKSADEKFAAASKLVAELKAAGGDPKLVAQAEQALATAKDILDMARVMAAATKQSAENSAAVLAAAKKRIEQGEAVPWWQLLLQIGLAVAGGVTGYPIARFGRLAMFGPPAQTPTP